MPLFSVVIPLYNKANFIRETIESVLAQSFTDYEIIIVEDCSTDKSPSVASSVISDKIRIINHEKNKGLSASRNTGIRHAAARYIVFLDADDLWKPHFLSEIKALIDLFPQAGMFATGYEEIYKGGKKVMPVFNEQPANFGIVSDFFAVNLGQPIYCPSSLCVDKFLFEKAGYYNEKITYGEDVDFNIRANSLATLAYSAKPLVEYRMFSENQITNTSLKNKAITDFDSYDILSKSNPMLKKYLDFHRYVMAKLYKVEGDEQNFRRMLEGIDKDPMVSGLNKKQLALLDAPAFILKLIKIVRTFLASKGKRISTYR